MPRVLQAFKATGDVDRATIAKAAKLLREGRLVAVPTETVYGLAANALDEAAVRRIFEAKGRPAFNPLIVHVPGVDEARRLSSAWPELAERLAGAFWPGPLTLIVPKAPSIPEAVTAGLPSVALRAPSHPVARALLLECGLPLAAPSANLFGAVSPTTAAHVAQSLGEGVDLVLDGGPCEVGIESTVIHLTGGRPRVLRPGGVTAQALASVIGPVDEINQTVDTGARPSPGLLSRHYAPRGKAQLVAAAAFGATLAALPPEARIGAVVRELPAPVDARLVAWERLGSSPEAFQRRLYAALHRLDEAGATDVLLESPPDEPEWEAVADRLRRAAGPDDSSD